MMKTRGGLIAWSFEIDRAARLLAIVREEVAFRVLSERDWLMLGECMYGRSAKYFSGSEHNESGLFAFERAALERVFPPPPAAILVGACGGGRELYGLVERGYRIAAAYDPVVRFIDALRKDPRLSEAKERLCVGSHQGIQSIAPLVEMRERGTPIDAVIVGWGSYTHLLGRQRRVQFLRALRAACPRGPVLLSFFVEMAEETERLRRLRSQLRCLLGTNESMVEPGDGLHRGAGGVHYFTQTAFTLEASQAGYHVAEWQEHDFASASAILTPAMTTAGA